MFRRNNFKHAKDEDLVVALQKGRQRALEELYLRYNERVRYYFFRMTGQDTELARDFSQDLFVKVSERANSFEVHRSFRTWLFSMAHNMCKNHYRHQEVRRSAFTDLKAAPNSMPSASILAGIDAETFKARIDLTLSQVDTDRRSAFLLRHRDGLSLREIAEVQDCPLGTVKSRLHHVHQFLASQLADLKPEIFEDEHQRQ